MSKKPWSGQKRPENNQSANKRMGNAMKNRGMNADERRRFHEYLHRNYSKDELNRLSFDECQSKVDFWYYYIR